jgi:hypothetical protein
MEPPEQVEEPSPEKPAPSPAQAEKPVRVGMWLAIAGVVVVCGVFFGHRLLSSVLTSESELSPDENAATVATVAYLDAVLADDLSTAYGLTCTEIHNEMTLSEFDTYQSDRDQILRYELVDVRVSSAGGELSAVVETEMSMIDGRTFPQNLAVAKESAGWRVCK